MKTFSADALNALERGDAIVSASVEIIPSAPAYTFSTVQTVNLNAITDAATTPTGGLSVGTLVSGFSPSNICRVSMPGGGTYVAWSAWGVPAYSGPSTGSCNTFDVIPDGATASYFRIGNVPPGSGGAYGYNGYAAAQAAFGSYEFSGASTYRFFILDGPTADNSGGLSILVEKGVLAGGSGAAPIRLWGGYGDAALPSDAGTSTFQGIGDRGLIQSTTAAIGGTAQNLTLALSGIEAAALEVLEPDEVKNASVVVRRLIFDSAGKTLLGAYVFTRGRLDELKTSEVVGGAAAIQMSVEGAARGLGRRGGRRRSDADQRLVNSTDGFFRMASAAPEKTLYWGGKKPSVGSSALSSGSSVSSGGSISGGIGTSSF